MQNSFMQVIEQTVCGLGYDLIETYKSQGDLLRVTIDWPYDPDSAAPALTVDDCEKVTCQLQYVLEVEGLDYRRLEVSSPGIDRRLRNDADLERFAGHSIDVVLKEAIGIQAKGVVAGNRKKFRGILEKSGDGWQLLWSDDLDLKSGVRVSPKRMTRTYQSLSFFFDELQEARLAPIVDFKGSSARKSR